MLQRGKEENGRQMNRGCGKAPMNGDVLLPDNADGQETCRKESKEGWFLCKLRTESGVLLQSCRADINARREACVRVCACVCVCVRVCACVCVCSNHTFCCSCLYFYVTLSFSLVSISILKLF